MTTPTPVPAPADQEWADKRAHMERVYNLIQDEVKHIFPIYVGALDGQGAGARMTQEELRAICDEIQPKLSYHRSCLHASKVAAGLSKEEVLSLQKRRKKHAEYYTARLNSMDNEKVAQH